VVNCADDDSNKRFYYNELMSVVLHVWNDLSLDSRSAETYERFRSATKKHFYELAFTN